MYDIFYYNYSILTIKSMKILLKYLLVSVFFKLNNPQHLSTGNELILSIISEDNFLTKASITIITLRTLT